MIPSEDEHATEVGTMGLRERTIPSDEEYLSWRERFCNWGRWGADDENGTLNFVTDAVRVSAGALVRAGRTVSLARPIDTFAGPANPYPAHHMVGCQGSGGMLDYIGMFIHGFTQTHIDALCHLRTHDNRYWNDKPVGALGMPAEHSGTIDFWNHGIVTRGVLYDIPRLRSTDYVEPGRPVMGWELYDAATAQGVEPRAGDAVLIRSGHGRYYELHPDERPAFGSPSGVHATAVEFLYETDASLLCWDWQDAPTDQQGIANPMPISVPMHVHHIVLPYMGMPIIDNAELEALAAACAELSQWEFQFVCAPLVIPSGTGSPVNPLAIL
jgi:kynurenine formamidase